MNYNKWKELETSMFDRDAFITGIHFYFVINLEEALQKAKSLVDAIIGHPVYTMINELAQIKSHNDNGSHSRQLAGHCASSVRQSRSRSDLSRL